MFFLACCAASPQKKKRHFCQQGVPPNSAGNEAITKSEQSIPAPGWKQHTSKFIHDIGSSCGISVLLINLSSSFSSSNWTVKMAPGGVQVPIIRWWRGILRREELLCLAELNWYKGTAEGQLPICRWIRPANNTLGFAMPPLPVDDNNIKNEKSVKSYDGRAPPVGIGTRRVYLGTGVRGAVLVRRVFYVPKSHLQQKLERDPAAAYSCQSGASHSLLRRRRPAALSAAQSASRLDWILLRCRGRQLDHLMEDINSM